MHQFSVGALARSRANQEIQYHYIEKPQTTTKVNYGPKFVRAEQIFEDIESIVEALPRTVERTRTPEIS